MIQKSSLWLLPIFLPLYASAFTAPRRLPRQSNSASPYYPSFVLSSSPSESQDVSGVAPPKVVVEVNDQSTASTNTTTSTKESTGISATGTASDPKITRLKEELFKCAERLNRGFQATKNERDQVKDLIFQLAPLNPTKEPASPYYENASKMVAATSSTSGSGTSEDASKSCTLSGKWTLIYTDAPDITGLDTSRNPLSTSELGRIGQECSPPYIKNVIEWKRPEWARSLPFSGSDETRILQKVVTSASASPEKPRIVNLKVAGLELEAGSSTNGGGGDDDSSSPATSDLSSRIEKDGLIAGLLSANPVDLKGPLNPPFGQFEVLYLDDELRIIKTYQNYLAVNRRIPKGEEWF